MSNKNNVEAPIFQLMEKSNLIVDKELTYIKNASIVEYDLEDAGFNIIRFRKFLDDKTIKWLTNLNKKSKNIEIGKLQRIHKDLANNMMNEFARLRKSFAFMNKIEVEEVLCIKKDAIYLINKQVTHTKLDNFFDFRKKNEYTSYMYINRKEFYFGEKGLDTKGLSDEVIEKASKFFLKDITTLMRMAEKLNKEDLISYLKNYREKYLNGYLPLETYRNLDTGYFEYEGHELDVLQEDMWDGLDISYNYVNYLIPIIQNMI